MMLYIDSAQRGGDILDYRWSEIESNGIQVTQNKAGTTVFVPFTDWMRDSLVDLSRFNAALLIAFIAAKETDYGTETDGRIPLRCSADRADQW
ncbi:hypothetical protein SAMN04488118_11656 [Epibacterium ulvae]|uniref:Phage integrase family protein n=1 Tax=Epibacterium ulvae TaxID=1156985 RepID=A0A1G5RGI3_9RHOB|nr:hypothetical protein SAMN04488118_11656 [Epibacterium ulvae]